MPVYKPSELREFLEEIGAHPKKSLSQNFLIDGNIIRKIAASAVVQPEELILEIGPGPGSLTEELLLQGAHVLAVEMDAVLADKLTRFSKVGGKLEIFNQDIMTFDFQKEIKSRLKPGQKAKVVANLPYHLTTPILASLAPFHELFSEIVVMVQKEVADRFVAAPGERNCGSISVLLHFFGTPRYGFTVGNKCFFPAPKVDSAVVLFSLHKPLIEKKEEQEMFFKFMRQAFLQRRKTLRASLKNTTCLQTLNENLTHLNLSLLTRPEELTLSQWIYLFQNSKHLT